MSGINSLMGNNFIEYASYVIKDRAIPDINDGLKPVQRRIFHSLDEMDDGKFNKVANIVGNTMKYHPHGDASIYSSLVVLANKEYFIDRQGNFGNIYTGDEASASRYIECRLSPFAKEVLYNKEITEFSDSYDGRNKEPVTLPAKVPLLLMIGTEGIAVGMATKILPHNLYELLDAQIKILQKKSFELYPDFIQGGMIDVTDYNKGNGKVKIRGVIKIKDDKTLIISQIPYGTTTESLIASIESAAKKNRIKISGISDFTSEHVEIEVKTSRGEKAQDLIDALYLYTDCEVSITVNLITIVNGKPMQLSVDEVLKYNTDKLVKDLERELELEKARLRQKLHDLTLEQIFIENRIYKKIEEVKVYDQIFTVITKELNKFKKLFIRDLEKKDIERLLEIKIKRISRYDIEKHKKDIDDIVRALEEVEEHLKDVVKYTINYIRNLIKKYKITKNRNTKIIKMEQISAKEVKQPDVKVSWDTKGGFLGTDVRGTETFNVKPHDRFIIFQKKGVYKVISIESKTFIDTDIIYLAVYNPDTVFSVIYTDLDTKVSYVKKFKLQKYIQNKAYPIGPAKNRTIIMHSDSSKAKARITYEKKPRQKVSSEIYDFADLAIKGSSVRGNKLSSKVVTKVVEK